ncbi:MAG: hypothetical protein ABEJ58_06580, partial [Halodesulfurarchaeum sp.]
MSNTDPAPTLPIDGKDDGTGVDARDEPVETEGSATGTESSDGPNPILELENVSKQYGEEAAVSDVTFEVYEGEIVTLLGPSG